MTKQRYIEISFAIIVGGIGLIILVVNGDWLIGLSVFLMMWANNVGIGRP